MKLSKETQEKLDKLSPEEREKVIKLAAETLLLDHLNRTQGQLPSPSNSNNSKPAET